MKSFKEFIMESGVHDETGLPLNRDGTVTVYHHTSADAAKKIKKTQSLHAAAEPHVYVTSHKHTDTGYGDTAVKISIHPSKLELDDEFPNGRKDYKIHVKTPGGRIPVKAE